MMIDTWNPSHPIPYLTVVMEIPFLVHLFAALYCVTAANLVEYAVLAKNVSHIVGML